VGEKEETFFGTIQARKGNGGGVLHLGGENSAIGKREKKTCCRKGEIETPLQLVFTSRRVEVGLAPGSQQKGKDEGGGGIADLETRAVLPQ